MKPAWNRYWRAASLAPAVAFALGLAGCAPKGNETDSPTPTTTGASEAPAPSEPGEHAHGEHAHGEHEHGEGGQAIVAGETTTEILAQIEAEQGKLKAAIDNGQLSDVHHLAFGIRDLVIALEQKAAQIPGVDAAKLGSLVEQVKVSARRLDELGDAGNLSGTQAELAKFNTTLAAVQAAIPHEKEAATKQSATKPSTTVRVVSAPPQAVTLGGEIIDPQCYFTHASRGPEHASCALMCAKGGQGLSFLDEGSGTVYPLIAKSHGKSQNEGLLSHVGKPVQVRGTVYRMGGNAVLLIQSVTAAPKKPVG